MEGEKRRKRAVDEELSISLTDRQLVKMAEAVSTLSRGPGERQGFLASLG